MPDRVSLRLNGLMLERLLELALADGVAFQTIRRTGSRELLLVTDRRGAVRVKRLAEAYHLDCRVSSREGLSALLEALRRRWTLLVSVPVCLACLALLLGRVWRIDISLEGNASPEAEAVLREALAALDIRPGVPRDAVDPGALELALSARAEGFSFVGVRLEGVRLLVEAAPEEEAPELYRVDAARDLVAAADGVVLSVNARSGMAAVSPGDTVRAGQVLIRGEERVSKEEKRGVAALGEVEARTWYAGQAEGPTLETRRTCTGNSRTSAALMLLDWQFSLTECDPPSPAEPLTELLPVGGLILPLRIERVTWLEYREETVPVDEEALRERLAEVALAAAAAEMSAKAAPGCQIIDKWIDYSMIEGDRLRARAVLEVKQNIAVDRGRLIQGG